MRLEQKLQGDRGGETFERKRDRRRLDGQALRVFEAIKDGKWYTLQQIALAAKCPEASASARLRDFRRPEFLNAKVEREYVSNGLHKYRLILPQGQLELFQN